MITPARITVFPTRAIAFLFFAAILCPRPGTASAPPIISYEPPQVPVAAGAEFLVLATVEDDSPDSALTVTIHWRTGDAFAFTATRMGKVEGTDLFLHRIRGGVLSSTGFAFYLSAQDETSLVTLPTTLPDQSPLCFEVQISGMEEVFPRQAGLYRMFSAPITLSVADPNAALSVLGPYDPSIWRFFRWFDGRYLEVPQSADVMDIQPGRGFWLVTAFDVTLDGFSGLSSCLDGPVAIPLEPGWNQIGCPFDFGVLWDDVVKTANVSQLYRYNVGEGMYEVTTHLQPWNGYFVENISLLRDTIMVGPIRGPSRVAGSRTSRTPEPAGALWSLVLTVESSSHRTRSSRIAVHTDARPGRDPLDLVSPPLPPQESFTLSLWNEQIGSKPVRMMREAVPPVSEPRQWSLSISGEDAWAPVRMAASTTGDFPVTHAVYVVEDATGVVEEIAAGKEAFFPTTYGDQLPARESRNFTLLIGPREELATPERPGLAPSFTGLVDIFPNPGNPHVNLVIELSETAPVTLNVFDVRGRRVQSLEVGVLGMGRHVIPWDGRSISGAAVASGVYFVEFSSRLKRDNRKILIVR